MWSVCKWSNQWWLVFVLLGVDATLGDEYEIWEHLHSFREVKCLLSYSRTSEWVYETLRLSRLAVEHSVVVMTTSFQSRQSQIESYGLPIFNSCFIKFEFRINRGIGVEFWDPSWGVQLLLWWNIYLLFNSDIVSFVWKTDEGEAESIVLLIFVL